MNKYEALHSKNIKQTINNVLHSPSFRTFCVARPGSSCYKTSCTNCALEYYESKYIHQKQGH